MSVIFRGVLDIGCVCGRQKLASDDTSEVFKTEYAIFVPVDVGCVKLISDSPAIVRASYVGGIEINLLVDNIVVTCEAQDSVLRDCVYLYFLYCFFLKRVVISL